MAAPERRDVLLPLSLSVPLCWLSPSIRWFPFTNLYGSREGEGSEAAGQCLGYKTLQRRDAESGLGESGEGVG